MQAVHTTPLPPLPETAIRRIEQAKWHLDVAIRTARDESSTPIDHLRQAHAGIANAIAMLNSDPPPKVYTGTSPTLAMEYMLAKIDWDRRNKTDGGAL